MATHIPQHTINPQAWKGILIANLNQYGQYVGHEVGLPHRDDHFTLLLLTSGRFDAMIDFEPVIIDHPAIFVIRPEQVHQMVAITAATGWLLNIDSRLLPPDLIDPFYAHPSGAILLDDSVIINQLKGVLEAIAALLPVSTDVFVQRALNSLVHTLFALVLSLANTQRGLPKISDRSSLIYQQFRTLLETHYTAWKRPYHYADSLSLSPVYFNDTVRQQSGHSVSVHIQLRNVLEAKRLLVHTDYTAHQISHQLGYDDPIYFGKLFKKHTQLSPLQFRVKYRG